MFSVIRFGQLKWIRAEEQPPRDPKEVEREVYENLYGTRTSDAVKAVAEEADPAPAEKRTRRRQRPRATRPAEAP